ncbi:MAG: 30S ribosomal protein S21 [Myxococcales bacterium]|nr:30S ribosomal protein S21 [Myxococcales bacterium]
MVRGPLRRPGGARSPHREKRKRIVPENPSAAIQCKPLEVVVGDRGIERALKHLKRKLATEGILRELKRRRHYMKPSVKRRKKESEAARRRRKRIRIGE